MANKYMLRDDAPFGDEIWSKLDEVVVRVASSMLSGRRLLDIEGPYGLELKSVPLQDAVVAQNDVTVMSSSVLPIPLIECVFTLTPRDLATYEESGFEMDTEAIAKAAITTAHAEDSLIFEGNGKLGIKGLLNAEGVQSVKMGDWNTIGTAANDVISGIGALDAAGFHGPYQLALAPDMYNLLYRLYPQGYQVEKQHVESIIGSSVIKAPGIKKGGVLMASGKQYASIVIGQDLAVGFIGPEDTQLKFKITESLVPRIRVPASICVFKA